MRKLLILFISVMCFGLGQAQINIASGGTVTAGSCGNTFVDSGGAGGDYLNGESHQITICPDTPGTYIQLEFITFNTESATWDPFIVYEGTGTGGTVIGTYGGDPAFSTTLPPDIGACAGGTYIASSDPSGCITITFTSDGSGIDPGWEADIVCTTTAGGDAITGGTTPPANSVCGGSGAFCADAGALEFANTSNADCVPDADPATVANSCLGSAPNPAWYFIEIGQAGDIIIDISQTTGTGGTGTALDVDYVVWGPFNDPADACTDFTQGDCTADHTCTGNVVDCSFDFAATETATIPNAQVGEFYMFLITNFDGDAGFITLDQTNTGAAGAGGTDCCPFEAGVDPTTCGATDGSINVSLLLANTSYTITYDDPLGNPQSITTTSDATGLISITGLGAGTYTNIDTGTAGCSTATITLTAGAAPVFNTLTSNDPICSGEDAVFTLSGTAGATVDYTTTTNGAQSVVLDGSGNATITVSGITADETMTLTQISLAGCTVVLVNSTTVTIGAGPTADASPNTTPICEGSTAVFDITGTPNAVVTYNTGGANTTITLNGAGTASVSIPGATVASEVINLVSVANAGAPVPGVGASATGGQNPGNAAGAIEALGTDLSAAGLAARVTNGAPSLVITLQHTVPAGTSITVSIARDNNAGAATITDGTANLNFSAGPNDDSQQVTFVTGVATNTITINRTGGAVWVDGVSYMFNSTGCTVPLTDTETITVNPAVDAGLDGALTSCATGGTTDLFGQLGGTPQVGGVWSPAMASGTGVFDPTVDAGVTYTYTVTGTAPCADATADVVVTITAAPDAGTNGTLVACDSDGTTDLFGQLGGTPDAGGVWSPAMASGTGVFDPAVDAATTYTYTINIAGCTIVSADVVVTVNPAVDAGLDGALTSCATGGTTDLFGQLGGTPQVGGVWSPAMASGTGVFDPTVDAGVTYTYTVTGTAPCADATADVVVTITAAPDAGTNGTLVACDSDGTTDLFGQLGGTPDAGGVWSPAMASGTGVFDPAVDAATTYTYTINIAGCTIVSADVVVTVNPAVDAGLDGALTSCATGGTTDLFGQLGGTPQAGGVWSPAMASGTGVFDPTVDAGVTYTYTVTGTAPCADATADVVVTITAAPDAGTNGTLVACDSDGTTDLFGQLGGTPDAGGVWSPAMASGTGVFDPAVDAATTYTYTINIAGCTIVSADVVVTVNPAVDAGLDGALTSCATGGTTDLFGQLGGTPQVGGVWSPAMASGTGVFDPTVDAGVTYTYTVTGTAPCADATADVVVTITAAPDAGTNGTLVACDSDGTTDLFGQLGGTPDAGGVWSPAMASGTGVFDPAVDAATTYTYTINIAGCTIVSADVVVTVNPAVDAGLDGALTSCATGGTTDLFGQLGGTPQVGGVWSPAMASGTGVFDPTVDAGVTYTYTVTGTAPCADATADVVVTITAAPDAGTNGTLVACDSDGTTDLFGQLGGTPDVGGVWSPAMASGTGVFDPAVDAATTYTYTINIAGCTIVSADVVVTVNPAVDAGLDGALTSCATGGTTDLFGQLGGTPQVGGVWSPAMASGTGVFDPTVDAGVTYTYTVTGTAPCADATADVVVTITAAPDAGTNGTLVACDSDGTTDLFGQLGGTPDAGGVWSPAMASGTGVFDPAVDAATTYTYTINIAGCTIVSADVVVTVNPAVDAGLDGALTSCATGGTTDLFGQLGGTPQVGGVWSPAMASGTGVFDPTVDAGVTYTYTVTGTAPCADATADVVVTITAAPDAGTNGTLVACDSDGTTDLFGQLGGTPDAGGVWSPAMASGTGVFDPAVDAATTYTYTINIAGCTIVSADVVVTVNPAVDAGLDGALTSCATGGTTDLFGQLGGTPQVGGVWSPAMASGTGVFDPTVDAGVTYTYTVTGTAPCADATADVVVTITAAPDAGTNGTLVACDSDGTTDLFGQLGGTPDAGGVWSPAMASGTGVFDPAVDAATTYTYTINIAGCVISSADVVVTVNPAVDAGIDGALTSCATGGTTDLFGQLGGTPQVGGVWSPAMASGTGVFDPTVDAGVTYTYTVTGTAPCADATADVVVTITAAPDAGTNGTLVACDSDGTTDLFGQLGGTPDVGGVWSPAMASGTGVFDPAVDAATTYTYTINIAGCTIVSADVVVTVNPAVDAGLDGALTSCATGGTTDLFGQLGGTPQVGGVWSPAMASGTGVFDPTVDAGVTYTYTVTGTAPCADATADVVVTITAAPDAGTNGTLVACDSDGTTDLFGQLGGTPDAGGVWSPAMASGTGVFDPAVDAATTYTYTINIAGCTIVSADVVVTVNPAVDAGLDGALTSCATGGTTDLFGQLGGTPQAGGVWSPAMASGTGVFDPTVDAGVTYTYTVTGTAPCADATADVVVTITAAPDAGTNGTLVACDSDGTTDLFGQLGGTPDVGGVWSPAMASGTGVFDPAVDAATTYTYTINIAGCTIVSADVVVTVNPAVDAGIDGALTSCATGGTTDLFGQLGGTPQAGGVWSPAMASGTGVFDPTVDAGVTYTYTVTGTAPCADATADVVVTITAAPDAGTNGTLVVCNSDGITDLFGQLGGTPDAGGVWSPAMASGTGVFDPAVDAATTYTYTINIAGCALVSADVLVTVNQDPLITLLTNNSDICAMSDAIFTLVGTADAVVTYSVDGGASQTVTLDATGNGIVTVPTVQNTATAVNVVLTLSDITNPTTLCSTSLTNTSTVVVNPNPDVTSLTNNSDICAMSDAIFTLVGTADAVVTYSVDGGASQTVTLDATGNGVVTVPTVQNTSTAVNVVLTLSDITNPTTLCSTSLTSTSTVIVNPNPDVTSLTNNSDICAMSDAIFTLVGTADAVVTYSVDGGASQTVTLDATGNGIVTVPTVQNTSTAVNVVLTLSDITNPTTLCSTSLTNTSTVVVNPNPDVTSLTNNSDICAMSDAIFTLVGTADAVVTYSVDGGASQTVTLDATGNGIVTVPTVQNTATAVNVVLTLSDITNPTTLCSTSLTNTSTVVVNPNPDVTSLTNNSDICAMSDAIFTLVGTADAVVTYSVDGGAAQTVTLDATGNGIVTVPTVQNTSTAVNVVLTLSDITNPTTLCSTSLTNTSTVVVNPNPDVTSLTNNSDICAMSDAIFTLVGTADAVVTYSVDGGASQTVTLDATGNGIVTVPTVQNTSTAVNVVLTLSDITNPTTLCSTSLTSTSTVVVNPNPLPNAVADMEECDVDVNGEPDLDGLVVFDLASNTNAIANGLGNVSVSYYTALDGTGYPINQVADATAYTNDLALEIPLVGQPNVMAQPIYVLVVNNDTGCYGVSSFNLIVNTVTFTPAVDLFACDDDNDTFGYFDLAAAELQMTGGATNLDVTFHETLAEAEQGVGIIPTNVLYQNVETDIPGVQTLYLNVTDTDTGCSYTAETIVLNVLASPVLPEGALIYPLCEDVGSTDGFVVFDLLDYAYNQLAIDPALNVAFYTGLDASGNPTGFIGNPGAYTNTSLDQVIYIAISNSSLDSNGDACTTLAEITLHVDSLPAADHYLDYVLCDDDYYLAMDGTQTFDLPSQLPNMIASTDGLVITYYQDWDALTGIYSNPIDASDLESYDNTSNPQDIFVEFVNEAGCPVVKILKLTVNPNPTPLSNQQIVDTLGNEGVMEECDGDVDGSGAISEQVATFDLTQWETVILTGTGPAMEEGVSATYYTSIDNAESGVGAIGTPTAFTNTSNPQTIYMSVVNDGTGINPVTTGTGCATIVEFQLFVPVPEVSVIADKEVICIDVNGVPLTDTSLPLLTATAGPQDFNLYDYQWSLNGVVIAGATNNTLEATVPGDYTVTVSGPTDFDCINVSQPITIGVSGIPSDFNASVTTNAFADSHQVVSVATSNIPGVEFWYSLDGGVATMDGTFDNVSPGLHYVTITDGEGCWSHIEPVTLIDYPHFFTPNGDGINDTWAIIGQEGIPISQIYIFDRFGKLLKQLDPDGAGWDGTYNGSQMPATDYWFKIIYIEGTDSTQKEFKAHFTIKR